MVYKCIDCSRCWGDKKTFDGTFSHGLCPFCLRKALKSIYIKEQLKFSGVPCFGTAEDGICDREDCKYRETCLVTYFEFIEEPELESDKDN